MARSLSMDLRERVVRAVDAGASRRVAAARFGVSVASAVRWCALARDRGDASPRPQGGDRRSQALEAQAGVIDELMIETPDQTLMELRDRLGARGVKTTHTSLWRFFRRHGVTPKKRMAHPVCKGDLELACWSASTYPVSRL